MMIDRTKILMFGGGHRKGVDGKDWIEKILNPQRVPQREFVIVLTPTIYLSKIARREKFI